MNKTSLLFGILPLIVFVLIDSFAGMETGIISAVLFAVVEAAYSLYKFKKLDGLTFGSLLFVGLFGYLSYYTKNPLFFKLQPVILGICFSLLLLIMQLMKKPLLVLIAKKYRFLFPSAVQKNLTHPFIVEKLSKLSFYLGIGLGLHTGAVAYSAFYMSNWWWIAIRGIGLYLVMGICVLIARFT